MTLKNLSNPPAVYISFPEYIGIPFWTCRYASMHEQDKVKYPKYRIVTSTSLSRIEAHAGLFRSLMKGNFDPYVL